MLGKLIKHEFRATGRIMVLMLLILLATSIGGNISIRIMSVSNSLILNSLAALLLFAFAMALIAASIVALVVMINRFRTNLLGNEGYVMFTLPASVHQQVWSKLIVSTVWFVVTGLAALLACCILVFRINDALDLFAYLQKMLSQITAYYALNGVAIILEFLALLILGSMASCLMFYAAMSIGHSFANHKGLLSVAFFFVIYFVMEIIGLIGIFGSYDLGLFNIDLQLNGMEAVHLLMAIGIGSTVIYGTVFYLITTFMLKKHLNLE